MIKNSHSQNGSAHVALTAILIIALIGALGVVFWKNYSAKNTEVTPVAQSATTESSKQTTAPPRGDDDDDGYLILSDWGVKFKLPATIGEVKYYKLPAKGGAPESYELTTARVENLGGRCAQADDNGDPIRLVAISRSVEKSTMATGASPINNNETIGGYYYYVSGAQSTCADVNTDAQMQDRNMLVDAVKGLALRS